MIESVIVLVFFVILRITAGVYTKSFDWLSKTILPLDIACCIFAAVVALFVVIDLAVTIRNARNKLVEERELREAQRQAKADRRANRKKSKSRSKK